MDDHVVVVIALLEYDAEVPCGIGEGQFVRRRGVVIQDAVLLFDYDGMADSENVYKVDEVLVVIRVAIVPCFIELGVGEVDVGDAFFVFYLIRIA
jgi:hypothetical protein